MINRLVVSIAVSFFLTGSASACSDCEDKVCVFTTCACVYNINRCNKVVRHSFCNITDNGPNRLSSCTNCASIFDGDAGKSDCLGRYQGHYVKFGECVANECERLASIPSKSIFANLKNPHKEKTPAPVLTTATAAQIDKLEVAAANKATAKATLTKSDGSRFSCSYQMAWQAAKFPDKSGIQFVPKSETCVALK